MSDTYKNIKTNGAVPKDEPIVAEAVQPTEVPEPHSAPTSRQRELLDQAEDLMLAGYVAESEALAAQARLIGPFPDDPNAWLVPDEAEIERKVQDIKTIKAKELIRVGWQRGSTGYYSRWFDATKTRPRGWAVHQASEGLARLVQDYLDQSPEEEE
jgi:hypothetical protein